MPTTTQPAQVEKRPRGRPRAYEPETALRQAAEVFWRTGYAGTSLDDIAVATGMNRPSLRAAFGDKHDIYVKALRSYWELKFSAMHEALERRGTLAERLMKAYDAALSIYFSGDDEVLGCFVVGTAVTEAPGDAEIRSIAAEGFRMLDTGFEACFKQARATGELAQESDPKALSMLASATMHSIAVRARTGSSRSELRKLAQKAVKMICG